jgi:hypothetical protein
MMSTFRQIKRRPEFDHDLRRLLKSFSSLEGDLATFIDTELNLYHKLKIDNGGIFRLTGLGTESPRTYKAKKFACRALKGRGVKSGIRVIYAYHEAVIPGTQ